MKMILGTVQFGMDYGINNPLGKPDEKQVFEIFDFAYQNNIHSLDTAEAYGNIHEIIGNYHKARTNRFEINTKFTASSTSLNEQVNSILSLLKIDSLGTLYYHSFDDFNSKPLLLEEMRNLVIKGVIKKIGLSIYSNVEFARAINNEDINVIQLPFNLFDNFKQRGELLKNAKDAGKIIHVRSIFLQGLFFLNLDQIPPKLEPLKEHLVNLHQTVKLKGESMEHLCLAYAKSIKQIDNIIIGVDNLEQLANNLAIYENDLDRGLIEEINRINVSAVDLLYPKNWN